MLRDGTSGHNTVCREKLHTVWSDQYVTADNIQSTPVQQEWTDVGLIKTIRILLKGDRASLGDLLGGITAWLQQATTVRALAMLP